MGQEETRKGPWTKEEDVQLALYVNLFGDRRWDFIAKVSGLKRTGKSCRLRWVNYLHPGLKRGKMTPHEERLVVELHAKWGNRWSKIARKLPGRTDNEVKNYWRTYMRKKAQEKKKAMSSSSSQSSISSSSPSSNSPTVDSMQIKEIKERNFYDTGGLDMFDTSASKLNYHEDLCPEVYSMDEIWKEVELSGSNDAIKPVNDSFSLEGCGFPCSTMASPIWDYCPDMLWKMDDEESFKMFMPMSDNQLQYSFHNQENKFRTG